MSLVRGWRLWVLFASAVAATYAVAFWVLLQTPAGSDGPVVAQWMSQSPFPWRGSVADAIAGRAVTAGALVGFLTLVALPFIAALRRRGGL